MKIERSSFPATVWLIRVLFSRRAIRFYAICAVIVISFAAFVQVQAHIARHRSEVLLVDIQQLELRKSTWSDASKLMNRWGAWGHYDGSCTAVRCKYQIEISDFRGRFPYTFSYPLMVVSGWLGGRPFLIYASFEVREGIVWGKDFGVGIGVPPSWFSRSDFGFTLLGGAKSVSRFSPVGQMPQLSLHRDYTIRRPGGCTGCKAVYVDFTPYASASDIQRLMNFNLSCMTRWKPCLEWEDIMPVAWQQHMAEQSQLDAAWDNVKCNYPLDLLGRESENAVIADVTSNHTEGSPGNELRVVKFRLVRKLKGAQFWEASEEAKTTWFKSTEDATFPNPRIDSIVGSRLILFFEHDAYIRNQDFELERCGLIPFKESDLAEVERGIAEDYLHNPGGVPILKK